jgi:cellulose synthase operon protein C
MRRVRAFLLLVIGLWAWPAYAADRADAEAALVEGVNADRAGNRVAAKALLLESSKADPDWALPHAVQSAMLLEAGDGFGGEAEARKAVSLGMKPQTVNQLLAHAFLLQGEAQQALDLANDKGIAPKFRGYAARIRARALAGLGDYQGAA